MPEPRNKKSWLDETRRVDPYRTDEDSGGQGAPPLRPRDEIEQDRRDRLKDRATTKP
jgi:hypothetical protein